MHDAFFQVYNYLEKKNYISKDICGEDGQSDLRDLQVQ